MTLLLLLPLSSPLISSKKSNDQIRGAEMISAHFSAAAHKLHCPSTPHFHDALQQPVAQLPFAAAASATREGGRTSGPHFSAHLAANQREALNNN